MVVIRACTLYCIAEYGMAAILLSMGLSGSFALFYILALCWRDHWPCRQRPDRRRNVLVVHHRAGGGLSTRGPCSKAKLRRSPSIPNYGSPSQLAMDSSLIAATNNWSTRSMQAFLFWLAAPVQVPMPSCKPICSVLAPPILRNVAGSCSPGEPPGA